MAKYVRRSLLFVVLVAVAALVLLPSTVVAGAETQVYLGGVPLGIRPVQQGLVVRGLATVGDFPSPCAGAVQVGDVLLAVDDNPVQTRTDVARALAADGPTVTLHLLRDGRSLAAAVRPMVDSDGAPRLGLYLVDGLEGVGTLTFVTANTHCYAALGHAIEDDARPVGLSDGAIYAADIVGVVAGQKGTPGELQGKVLATRLGDIRRNTAVGLYGLADPALYTDLPLVGVLPRDAVQTGDAVVVCTVQGSAPRYYAVRITALQRKEDTKGITLTVTDPRLLSQTGGIVQGMSGSPILQNGRLVGAVTHVTVDDPRVGYGVFADVMLAQCALVAPDRNTALPSALSRAA